MKPSVERLMRDTYLAVVQNSVGTWMFREFYVRMDGKKVDAMGDGRRSCAFFVSSILTIFGLIERIHATVDVTVEDLKKSGWRQVKEPKPGDVLVWEKQEIGGNTNRHIGFYVSGGLAISNSYSHGVPTEHHWTYGGTRMVETIFRKSFSKSGA